MEYAELVEIMKDGMEKNVYVTLTTIGFKEFVELVIHDQLITEKIASAILAILEIEIYASLVISAVVNARDHRLVNVLLVLILP